MACNPAYIIPLVCVTLGALSLLTGLLLAIILASDEDHVSTKNRKAVLYGYIPALCGAGGIGLATGCCACCTLQVKKGKNWAECKRKQRAHKVVMGRYVLLSPLYLFCGIPYFNPDKFTSVIEYYTVLFFWFKFQPVI